MRRRLVLTAVALTSAVVVAFCVPLALAVRYLAMQRAVDGAELESRYFAAVLATVHDPALIKRVVDEANASSPTPVTVYLAGGTVVGERQPDSGAVAVAQKEVKAFTANGPRGSRDVFVPVLGSANDISVIRVNAPASLLHRGVARSWTILGGLAALMVLVAVVFAERLTRAIVGPVENLVAVTERLRMGDLDTRAVPAGPPEIAEVAVAVNLLADRIVDLIATERERAADLSHRLRTPLTALRLDAEILTHVEERRRLTSDVDAVERAMTRVIRDARRPSGGQARTVGVNLETVVHDRMAFWSVLAEDQGRAWSVDMPPTTHHVGVAREDLDAALDALLGNIFAHTPEGTPFRVAVSESGQGRTLLVVEDEGPGITDQRAWKRGRSGRTDGLGTGLGLDIARRTAESSGGVFRIMSGRSGGCRVELELLPPRPRSAQESS